MEKNKEGGFQAPGTFVIVMFFFVWFVVIYFVNWAMLSGTWAIR